MGDFVMALDQGTTSSRAALVDSAGLVVARGRAEVEQSFPSPGLVEHDAENLWDSLMAAAAEALAAGGVGVGDIAAVGLTNQRETSVMWDASGALAPALVWQDRRTRARCEALRARGHETKVAEITGLTLDPYFSATRFAYLLDSLVGARKRAERGEVMLGTVDAWLMWRMTGEHQTDATNAARTSLYDIRAGVWHAGLAELFRVPLRALPEVRDCRGDLGMIRNGPLAGARLMASAGDQHAALIGQGCVAPGSAKITFGTGAFALANVGAEPLFSQHGLLATLAWRCEGEAVYALEGSIFIAGALMDWLVGLGVIQSPSELAALAARADPQSEVVVVPAFAGLGAPHWQETRRGSIHGLTRADSRAEIARAALEAMGYQARDLFDAMRADGLPLGALRVDGGVAANDWAMQFLADITGQLVERGDSIEATIQGVGWLAGSQAGLWSAAMTEAERGWRGAARQFHPTMSQDERDTRFARWRRAIAQPN